VHEVQTEAKQSLAITLRLFDARFVAGDKALFDTLKAAPLKRDKPALRLRLLPLVTRRHAADPAVTDAAVPDLLDGRGGLTDLQALRWLTPHLDERTQHALDLLLLTVSALETQLEHRAHRLPRRILARVAENLGYKNGDALLESLYQHARWVAFQLDSALSPPGEERSFGLSLAVKRGQLQAERLPRLEHVPSLGLRIAHLSGVAPPSNTILSWAAEPGPLLEWDAATQDQFWLLLRAADVRSWSFLDVTGLLQRYLPEWSTVAHKPSDIGMALDSHSFESLRRLHEWVDSGDPFAKRLWRTLRRRDWVYLAVLSHELPDPGAVARRVGLNEEGEAAVSFLAQRYALVIETASQRDVHDEDLLFDIAGRIGTPRRLRALFLVAVAHSLAIGGDAWSPWRVGQFKRLFNLLDGVLRSTSEAGSRRSRSVDHHRDLVARELERRNLGELLPVVARLPRRYLLSRSAAFIARHLAVAGGEPLGDGEVRLRAHRHRHAEEWDLLVVAKDRPGLLATVAGVLALRGASVLAADAATTSDGLVLDVFTVGSAYGAPLESSLWGQLESDLRAALENRLPLADLLSTTPVAEGRGPVNVEIDNDASQVFSLVEVRAPDRVGLLYRITSALYDLGLDIHHAKVATYPDGALDVFYVWDLAGNKMDQEHACAVRAELTRRLRG
jgi:UTP:GlnB (protein PII) uridylyltransferase